MVTRVPLCSWSIPGPQPFNMRQPLKRKPSSMIELITDQDNHNTIAM